MAKIILPGFGISSYRSFGSIMQDTGNLGAVTLLAGQNNSGKSNFLRALNISMGNRIELTPLDVHQAEPTGEFIFAMAQKAPQDFSDLRQQGRITEPIIDLLRRILNHPSLKVSDDSYTWIQYKLDGTLIESQFNAIAAEIGGGATAVCDALNIVRRTSATIEAHRANVAHIMGRFFPASSGKKPVQTIEAFRQIQPIGEGMTIDGTHEGFGLLPRLQKLQNPSAERHAQDSSRFAAINRFLQNILADKTAWLEVQHDAKILNVHHSGRILPLDHLGTGVHQVVILAVAATVMEDTIVCIEEPEVHLHPVYQRKLVKYLTAETSNQYVITTHSAHLLDYTAATVLHVRHNGTATELASARTPADLSDICTDLGYRPSDLLQTNAIIWVEGPSDRIYLQHWISQFDNSLVEGLHYSIMFYGGSLLNQLTSQDDEVTEFINLRRLNRKLVIVIDSDKKQPQTPLNDTKKRVRDEFQSDASDGFAWITDGYTIENYVPPEILARAVAKIHPSAAPLEWQGEKWQNPLSLKNSKGDSMDPLKNKIAHTVCDMWTEPPAKNSHFAKMIQACVDFIWEANRNAYGLEE